MRFGMVAIAMLISTVAGVAVAEVTPYRAAYVVERGGSQYGEASRELIRADDGMFELATETEISWLFLSDRRRYWSTFFVEDGRIRPQTFAYKRTGTGKNRNFEGLFDREGKAVRAIETGATLAIDWREDLLDEASLIEQVSHDMLPLDDGKQQTYQTVDEKGQQDMQTFQRVGIETLRLPYGEVEAVKVSRIRENSTRETDFWFAPELNGVLVKMQQREEGDEVATLLLRSLKSATGY